MMAQSVSFTVLVAALLINILPYCSAKSVYCVTPTATSCSSCPHNSIHCATLTEYAQGAELYFTPDTTMVFLPGDHVLDRNITVANVTRLTMHGESSSDNIATVVRNGSVGLSFTNMVDFNIYSLAFTSYNRSWSYASHSASNSALLLQSTQNAKLVNCSFYDNLGTALTVHNTNITLEGKSEFIRNKCMCEVRELGCGITAFNSTLTFNGNTFFHENNQTSSLLSCAGAIWASVSLLHFIGTNSFIGNLASNGSGGAIHGETKTSLSFIGTNTFDHNSAYRGGAICIVENVVLTFNGSNSFINNLASHSGGAIDAYGEQKIVVNFIGANNFTGNSAHYYGGAIHANLNTLMSFIGISTFSHNLAYRGGAICIVENVVLTLYGSNNFINNLASHSGGAIDAYGEQKIVVNFIGANNFIGNSAHYYGGAIHAKQDTLMSFIGTSTFSHNLAAYLDGGVIYAAYSVFTFRGSNIFCNNSASASSTRYGGVIYARMNTSLSFSGTSNFSHNLAKSGSVIYTEDNVTLIFNGVNNFINNSASNGDGGAICAHCDPFTTSHGAVLKFNGTNNFINNSANSDIANSEGGVIYAKRNTSLSFNGTSRFSHNSADFGGAIYTEHYVVLTFNGTNNFNNNSAKSKGGAIRALRMSLSFTGASNFIGNSAMEGGAISAILDSELTFSGNINFNNNGHNTGDSRGGAMYLAIRSTIYILPHTTLYWENNYARLGGAIYVSDVDLYVYNPSYPFLIYCNQITAYLDVPKEECFFQIPNLYIDLFSRYDIDVQLTFKNNSADTAGSVLYGGTIDDCKLTGHYQETYYSGGVFNNRVKHINYLAEYQADNTTSSIASDPFCICPCENIHPDWDEANNAHILSVNPTKKQPNCRLNNYKKTLSLHPGETFQVSVVAVGQRKGIVPANVISHMDRGRLLSSQYVQQTTKMCTTLNYTIFSLQNVTLTLYADGPCSTFGDNFVLILNINQTCPSGFIISQEENSCVCDQAIQKYTNHCNITNGLGQITRESDDMFWIGYDQSQGLTVHPHCPFDYCVNHTVVFPLNKTDIQCAYNRSGLLCGACNSKGYSLLLGSSHCKRCTNSYLTLLIPFALMGVALVFLFLVCKLTVATGTLSALVFYANIVGANRAIFLPVKSTDALSVFIAWLNLDFGIETCFYDGMDAYSKTWLQFVFPVYLWVLVGLVILVSHYSQRFANLLGSNPVSVLATLILFSYAKILHTFITAVSFIDLHYQYHYNRRAWLYDANIEYLVGKHIPLFLVAMLVFLFLFLPYTLLLLFGQWLQAISHLRLFSWVNSARLKPFMDSYHAPYKAKHRYWPGLLLVLRFVLLLVFASNPQQDPNINLLAILAGVGILQLWAWASGGVYKNWYLDALEGSFALNLTILAAAAYYVQLSGGNQLAVGYTSVSIALATFIGILAYHIFQQVRLTKLWKKIPKLNLEFKELNTKQTADNPNNPINDPTESVNLDQLREPWLEDLLQPTHSSF